MNGPVTVNVGNCPADSTAGFAFAVNVPVICTDWPALFATLTPAKLPDDEPVTFPVIVVVVVDPVSSRPLAPLDAKMFPVIVSVDPPNQHPVAEPPAVMSPVIVQTVEFANARGRPEPDAPPTKFPVIVTVGDALESTASVLEEAVTLPVTLTVALAWIEMARAVNVPPAPTMFPVMLVVPVPVIAKQ